jgi:hypothetical protein
VARQQPNSPLTGIVAASASTLLGLYLTAEAKLVGKFAALVAKYGAGDLLLIAMRKTAQQTVAELGVDTPPVVGRIIAEAINAAWFDAAATHQQNSAAALTADLNSKLSNLRQRITRFADDAYRAATSEASILQTLGNVTPADAQSQAWNTLMRKGISGFTDDRGRVWTLSSYVEMAVRTSVQRAYNASHLARMLDLGIDLFSVNDDGTPCPLCAPWEHQILSVLPDFRASATIEEATAAGLFHPNCRHVLVAYFPGVSTLPPPRVWTPEDQQRYDESQYQRGLERKIRVAKRELEAAFTPEMKTAAQKRLSRAQKDMRDFIDRTGLLRRPRREQLNLGNK